MLSLAAIGSPQPGHRERGRDLLCDAGGCAEWKKLVEDVRESHGAKYGFMPKFERLAAGENLYAGTPFLERARARWEGRGTTT